MASSGKRLDLRFGAFACSVQGFDDPVPPVQQILRAIQHLLEESPELADTAINFDAEAIEQLVGEVARRAELDEEQVEIVPGLILIHHDGGGDLAGLAGDAAGAWEPAEEAGATDYVNLFGAAGGDDEAAEAESGEAEPGEAEPGEAEPGEAGADEAPEEFAARLRRMADEAPVGNGAAYGWDDAEPAEERGAAEDFLAPAGDGAQEAPPEAAGEEAPVNLFAADTDDEGADTGGEVRNLFAESAEEDDDEPFVLDRPAGEAWQEADQASVDDEDEAAPPQEDYTAAGFAERAGARTVPDLMVSAAAFMALIRGQSRFTRRDVLDVFQTIPGDHEKTLEAQVKGFGKAVRNGQLVMVEDGVFGLSRGELDRFQRLL